MLFVIRPGHELPEVEDVVEIHENYEIVRKHENARQTVERSDRRHG
jgi:hypothetical protein